MTQSDPWPFTPAKLSSLIEPETLSVLLSGCSARLGRAMTVLDYDNQSGEFTRFDTQMHGQNFSTFCALLRDKDLVGGGNEACEACDLQMAAAAIREFKKTDTLVQSNYCHMHLTDYTHVVRVQGQAVAVLMAGQFGKIDQWNVIQEQVNRIERGTRQEIRFLLADVRDVLLEEVDQLPQPGADFEQKIAQEAQFIERIALERHRRIKVDREHQFYDMLRNKRSFGEIRTLQELRQAITTLLDEIRSFCQCDYIVFYFNVRVSDTVLTPVASSGLREPSELPHFNWRKANLDKTTGDSQGTHRHLLVAAEQDLGNGLRGKNVKLVADASCAAAVMLGNIYRSVMVFGPFQALARPDLEEKFLFQINRIASWYTYALLQQLRLREEAERRETITTLLQHRVRTALTPIAAHISNANQELNSSIPNALSWRSVTDAVRAAHDLTLRLGKAAKETLRSADIMVERSDLRFDSYPLSVLVANCAEGFTEQAHEANRKLTIDPGVENLPSAEVDIARLTIAISNMLENAVKYSYPSTTIYVRAISLIQHVDNLEYVDVVIENTGNPIPEEKKQQIFERGKRALVDAKMGKIPGTGYGLWETKAVIEAHGGMVTASSEKAGFQHRSGIPYRVTFTLRIPLSQS